MLKAIKDIRVSKVLLELKVIKVIRVFRAQLELEHKVFKALLELRVLKVLKETLVVLLSTIPLKQILQMQTQELET